MISNRIQLLNCNPEILARVLKCDVILAKKLKIKVPENWTEFVTDIFKFSQAAITKKPSSQVWWTYLAIDVEKKHVMKRMVNYGNGNLANKIIKDLLKRVVNYYRKTQILNFLFFLS